MYMYTYVRTHLNYRRRAKDDRGSIKPLSIMSEILLEYKRVQWPQEIFQCTLQSVDLRSNKALGHRELLRSLGADATGQQQTPGHSRKRAGRDRFHLPEKRKHSRLLAHLQHCSAAETYFARPSVPANASGTAVDSGMAGIKNYLCVGIQRSHKALKVLDRQSASNTCFRLVSGRYSNVSQAVIEQSSQRLPLDHTLVNSKDLI